MQAASREPRLILVVIFDDRMIELGVEGGTILIIFKDIVLVIRIGYVLLVEVLRLPDVASQAVEQAGTARQDQVAEELDDQGP